MTRHVSQHVQQGCGISSLLGHNSRKIAVYERIDSIHHSFNSMFGQTKVSCDIHGYFLAAYFPKKAHVCQFDYNCPGKSAWRCPSEGCESDLCRSDFEETTEVLMLSI